MRCSQLRNVWMSEIQKGGKNQAQLDALSWLTRMTLDVIGLAGKHTLLQYSSFYY